MLARVSVFVEQAHFGELSRAATVLSLLTARPRFDISGIPAHVYETSKPDGARIALVLGAPRASERFDCHASVAVALPSFEDPAKKRRVFSG